MNYQVYLKENKLEIPSIPNTMNFWHGGNLDTINDDLSQKSSRVWYGSGLYLITHYETARKYAKGNRKLYLVTVEKGEDISNVLLSLDSVLEFIDQYAINGKKKELFFNMRKYYKSNSIQAEVFNNMILNYEAIKKINLKHLRSFLINNGVDYELVSNPFGWGETMMVLFNTKKIVRVQRVLPSHSIDSYNL